MQKISGKEVSQSLIKRLKALELPDKILAAILIGEDPTSLSFLRQKEKMAKELGVDFRLYKLSDKLTNDDLRGEVGKISKQSKVSGVIVQLPLPPAVNKYYVSNAIPREKDVDVLGERALGAFYNDRNDVIPPAVGVVEEILKTVNYSPHSEAGELKTKKVAVLGLGKLVGKPISVWLTGKCRELYLLDKESDLEGIGQVDLVITGVGKAGLVNPKMLKIGAGVIDFGYYYFPDGRLSGDFDPNPEKELEKLSFYTPTPGGTGPILVAKLFENFYTLNKKR